MTIRLEYSFFCDKHFLRQGQTDKNTEVKIAILPPFFACEKSHFPMPVLVSANATSRVNQHILSRKAIHTVILNDIYGGKWAYDRAKAEF